MSRWGWARFKCIAKEICRRKLPSNFPIKIKCQGIPCLCSCRPFCPALKLKNNETFSRTKFQTCICSIVIEGQIAKYSNFYKRPSAVGKGTLKFRSFLMHFLGHFFVLGISRPFHDPHFEAPLASCHTISLYGANDQRSR